jgi:transcriptional regulator with XRE-family HTH domain
MANQRSMQLPTLTERLNTLFETVRRPDGRPWSAAEVAQQVTERGTPIGESFIMELRRGRRANARPVKLRALADFFGVPLTYFYAEDDRPPDPEEAVLRDLEDDPELRQVLLLCAKTLRRGNPADVAAIRSVLKVLDRVQRAAEAEQPTPEPAVPTALERLDGHPPQAPSPATHPPAER